MDRISENTLRAVIARVEAAPITPPDDMAGPARVMFEAIAAGNRARPWSQAHAFALADYCRVVVMWETQLALITTEGPIVDGKPNARFKVTQLLSAERLRLGKLLGLHIGARDRFLGGGGKNEETAREVGATMARAADAEGGDLLA